jgi:hypothetical protein
MDLGVSREMTRQLICDGDVDRVPVRRLTFALTFRVWEMLI